MVSEISEQIGILETLTGSVPEVPGLSFNPFSEDDLLCAHEQLIDGLSGGVGQYRDDPRVTIGALSRRLQLSEAGINKVLGDLRKRGIIERVGANKNGSWKVNL